MPMDEKQNTFTRDAPRASQPTGNMLEPWLDPKRFSLILAGLILAFFPGLIFGGKSLVFRDFGIFTLPNAYFLRECFWHGELPLWNPLNNCGIPFLAQWNTACLYPLTLIYLLLPLVWGLNFFLLLHLFIAGLGMYWLASQWTHHRVAAAVAGIAFAFNGLSLNCLMWISNLAALAWMPWVILLAEQAWRQGGRRVILTALVGTFQMLAGAPEIIVLTWLVVFALALGEWLRDPPGRLRVGGRLLVTLGLISLLSAAQLLPFFDLFTHSERMGSVQTSQWAIPTWGWASLFVPLFHCYQAPLGVCFQPGQDWTSSYYPGLGILTLALLALGANRTPRIWILAGFAVFGFGVALGEPGLLYRLLLKAFPPLGFMRYPIKFAFLTIFALPLMAAFAVAHFGETKGKSWRETSTWPLAMPLLAVLTVIAILRHVRLYPYPGEHWPVLLQNGGLRIVLLLLLFGTLLVYARSNPPRLQISLGLLLLGCVWLDLSTHAPAQNPQADASIFQPGLIADRLHPVPMPDETRGFLPRQNYDFYFGRELTNVATDYLSRRCVLTVDCNLLDNIAMADGFYSLRVREQREVFNRLFLAPSNAFPSGLADFLSVAFVPDPENLLAWQYRPTHLPLFSVGAKPEYLALASTPDRLLQTNFNPREVVYLPPQAQTLFPATGRTDGEVRLKRHTNQHLELEVNSAAPTILTLSQTYYPPWRASVNDRPVPIWQANYGFQAIAIPPGKSSVKLVYQDQPFYWGLILSGTALAGCLAGLFWLSPRRKRQQPIKKDPVPAA